MNSFIKKIFYSTILIILISINPLFTWVNAYSYEILYAFTISLINAIVGYYLVAISINKADPEFYSYVYGGMLIRMIFVFGFSIYIIKNNFVLMTPYMLFLMLFYTIHQWIEISSWLKNLPTKKIHIHS